MLRSKLLFKVPDYKKFKKPILSKAAPKIYDITAFSSVNLDIKRLEKKYHCTANRSQFAGDKEFDIICGTKDADFSPDKHVEAMLRCSVRPQDVDEQIAILKEVREAFKKVQIEDYEEYQKNHLNEYSKVYQLMCRLDNRNLEYDYLEFCKEWKQTFNRDFTSNDSSALEFLKVINSTYGLDVLKGRVRDFIQIYDEEKRDEKKEDEIPLVSWEIKLDNYTKEEKKFICDEIQKIFDKLKNNK